jgi:spermidine/putrescine transport system substrate-binding protein
LSSSERRSEDMNPRLTRDELLRRGAAAGALLAFPTLFAACGGGGDGEAGGEVLDVLNFSNWPFYMDVQGKRHPTLDQFTQETGIKVNYFEDVNSNDEYFAKIQGRLRQGEGIGRDIIVATDNSRFPALYVEQEWVQELDKELIPNIENLIEAQASPPFDPERKYSLPWLSGMDGIAWNEDITGPVTGVMQLLEDSSLKGRVTVFSEMADTLGLVLLDNGDDPAAVTDDAFDRALERIRAAVDSGQIRRFTGNDYVQPLATGDLAACIAWSGDIASVVADNPNLKWAIPDKGGIIWTDNMMIPLGGSVPTASTYMNFVYDPKIAAQIAVGTSYISAVKGVKEEAVALDPTSGNNPLIFPDDDTLSRVHFNDPEMVNNDDYITRWQEVQGQ